VPIIDIAIQKDFNKAKKIPIKILELLFMDIFDPSPKLIK
jgi:hypothetical protein